MQNINLTQRQKWFIRVGVWATGLGMVGQGGFAGALWDLKVFFDNPNADAGGSLLPARILSDFLVFSASLLGKFLLVYQYGYRNFKGLANVCREDEENNAYPQESKWHWLPKALYIFVAAMTFGALNSIAFRNPGTNANDLDLYKLLRDYGMPDSGAARFWFQSPIIPSLSFWVVWSSVLVNGLSASTFYNMSRKVGWPILKANLINQSHYRVNFGGEPVPMAVSNKTRVFSAISVIAMAACGIGFWNFFQLGAAMTNATVYQLSGQTVNVGEYGAIFGGFSYLYLMSMTLAIIPNLFNSMANASLFERRANRRQENPEQAQLVAEGINNHPPQPENPSCKKQVLVLAIVCLTGILGAAPNIFQGVLAQQSTFLLVCNTLASFFIEAPALKEFFDHPAVKLREMLAVNSLCCCRRGRGNEAQDMADQALEEQDVQAAVANVGV